MKTDDLVALLANGPVAADRHRTEWCMGASAAAGFAVALLLVWQGLGPRPDLAAAMAQTSFWLKIAFPAALAMAACAAACRLARPGLGLGLMRFAIALPVVVASALAVANLAGAPVRAWPALALGHSAVACLSAVVVLSVPALAACFVGLRALAPTSLRAAGACAGLVAGAVAATAYALHCDEMQPAFVALWYGLGMAIPLVAGAWLGPRLLHWR